MLFRSGPRLDNINRWREQVGMPAIDDAALDDLVKVVEIDGTRGFSLVLPGAQDGTKAMAVTVQIGRASCRERV